MGIKILLADDSVTAQNMGKKILSEAGHEVVTVSNGAAAAKKISEVKPDLVLLDVFMPGYSGLELCEKLRKSSDTAKLPVLLTVGRMEPYSPQEGARVKADGVIVKPFESSDLIAAVDRLAQKLNPGKAPDYSRTIRISAPSNFSDEAWKQEIQKKMEEARTPEPQPDPETQEGPMSATQIFGSKPPETYERTMRLDAKQIAELLKQAAAQNAGPEVSAVPASPVAEEFHVSPPAHPPEFHGADTSLPAFGAELTPAAPSEASHQASVPSFMGEYLPDHPASRVEPDAIVPAVEDLEDTVVMGPGQAPTPVKPISPDSIVQRFATEDSVAPTASVEGLELTAAAPVPDVAIIHESALEATVQASDAPTIVLRDPSLIDLQSASAAFPTHFAGSELPAPELAGAPEPAAEDEFEARLKAAMASYKEPSIELPISSGDETGAAQEIHALEESLKAKPDSDIQDFKPTTEQSGDISLETSWSMPQASSSLEQAVNALEQSEAGRVHAFEASTDNADAVSSTILTPSESSEIAIHETDDAVIEQMREGISDLPVDSAHLVESPESGSIAMAAAASVSAASASAPTISGKDAELEIGRALAAAVNSEVPYEQFGHAESEALSSEKVTDANKVAAAVEKVMKRELPNLIWKIMAELDVHKH